MGKQIKMKAPSKVTTGAVTNLIILQYVKTIQHPCLL